MESIGGYRLALLRVGAPDPFRSEPFKGHVTGEMGFPRGERSVSQKEYQKKLIIIHL